VKSPLSQVAGPNLKKWENFAHKEVNWKRGNLLWLFQTLPKKRKKKCNKKRGEGSDAGSVQKGAEGIQEFLAGKGNLK